MSDGGESCEELLNLLHQRLVATGEWNTLLAQLRQLLEESEWDTQLRDQAEQTLPNSVRDTMSAKIRDFLDRNLEDA
ncbi:SUS1 [Malassezia furfur]|nr:SUS1 [Malassezia furfur]